MPPLPSGDDVIARPGLQIQRERGIRRQVGKGSVDRRVEEAAHLAPAGKQRVDFGAQRRIFAARARHDRRLRRSVVLQRAADDLFDARPALGRHAAP